MKRICSVARRIASSGVFGHIFFFEGTFGHIFGSAIAVKL